jgi:uncharacterized protein YndB with AHSA1/START domain
MSSVRQQGLIEAPVEKVWELLADPSRYPEWVGDAIEVTGAPTKIEKGSTYKQKSQGPLGLKPTTIFEVVDFEDLREIRLRCQTSGYYSHWRLTEARGNTFADLELGIEPFNTESRLIRLTITKGGLRELAGDSLEGLQRTLAGENPE